MAVPTGTFTGFAAIGEREDLSDIIYDISPTDTPFMSNIGRGSCSAVLTEWQTDSLAAASATNKQIEGDDAVTSTATATVRFGNYTQIMSKTPRVSGTLRAVDTAGRRDEFSYQVAKRGREIKRDIESAFLGNQAGDAGSAATARALAGAGTWLFTNLVKKGPNVATTVVVASGVPSTAVVAGTAGTYSEADLKTVLEAIWNDGGDPDVVLHNSTDKKLASAFSGIATLYRDTAGNNAPASILGAADIYVSDWGQVQLVADRFLPSDPYVGVFDLEYWEAKYLRPIQQDTLAKTGDSDRAQLLCEVTLCCMEPDANGKVYTTGA